MRQISKKRANLMPERARVRELVLNRAAGVCEAMTLVPEIKCASPWYNRPKLECHELHGGSYRSTEWLDPDCIQALCQQHHDWVTEHKREYLDRLSNRDKLRS